MEAFLSLDKKDREQMFFEASAQRGMSEAVIEKDFWVCWMLDFLFGQSRFKEKFAFKGGTSLSKCYGLINRFSEDIDLILDWRELGYGYDEPYEERSNTKLDLFMAEANARASEFLVAKLQPELEQACSDGLTDGFRVYLDEKDPLTLCFDYPKSFSNPSILQVIRLESGSFAAWTPTEQTTVRPYVYEVSPELFAEPSKIRTVAPKRTFWEKATILHKEAHRQNGQIPPRYSRHYYDLYQLANSAVKTAALQDMGLLDKVVAFKERFYRANVARYDLAKPGTLRLLPPESAIPLLKSDYKSMSGMMFGEVPDFDDLLRSIAALEDEISALA